MNFVSKIGVGEELIPWSEQECRDFGHRFQKSRHRLCETGLFDDEALAALIDAYPRHLLQAFVVGLDPTRMEENIPVDTTGISGADAIAAVKRGRLWFKLLRIHEWKGPYADVVEQVYREMVEKCPGFNPLSKGAILFFGSTDSQVYFHLDAKPNMLWHLCGKKRFWLYPLNDKTVSQMALEDVYTMTSDEDVPFTEEIDQYATVFDLQPGDVLSWPHNAPHRVVVTEGMSVSLGTLHETEQSDRRTNVIYANSLLRNRLGVSNPSTAEQGVIPYVKSFVFRVLRRAGLIEANPRKAYTTSYILDPEGERGVRRMAEPVLTEFAKGPPATVNEP